MSIYFNKNGICNNTDIIDCRCSLDGKDLKKVTSIWGLRDSIVTKLWERKELDPYNMAPDNEYLKWDYTLDEQANTITLRFYKNQMRGATAIVYSNYIINGKLYKTKIASNSANATSSYMFISSYAGEIIFSPNVDTSETESMSYMFYNCSAVSIDFNGLSTKNVKDMNSMFYMSRAENINFGKNFCTRNVINMSHMFHSCKIKNLDLSNFDTSNVTNMSYMFLCEKLVAINFGNNFDTSNVTNMSYMFCGCKNLTNLDLGNFDTSNVINMSYMFQEYKGTSLDLSNFDTNKLINMSYMFQDCDLLENVIFGSKFNTINTTNMNGVFYNCKSLTSIDLSSFNTSCATIMVAMFSNCNNLKTIYVSENLWSTSQADVRNMFYNCGTSSVTYK